MRRRGRAEGARALVGPLEYAVLGALWIDAPACVATVRDRINASRSEPVAYTTVMTVLTRLHEKSLVTRRRAGRGYDYSPRFSETGLVDHLGRQEADELVDRYGAVALTQFAEILEGSDPGVVARIAGLAGRGEVDVETE